MSNINTQYILDKAYSKPIYITCISALLALVALSLAWLPPGWDFHVSVQWLLAAPTWVIQSMQLMSDSLAALFLLVIGMSVVLLISGRYLASIWLAVSIGIIYLIDPIKELFQHTRPNMENLGSGLYYAAGWSFPSGHSLMSLFLSGCLAYAIFTQFPGAPRKATFASVFVYTILVGLSRVYLGVHYIGDVVAGWLLGVALLLIYIYILSYGFKLFATKSNNQE